MISKIKPFLFFVAFAPLISLGQCPELDKKIDFKCVDISAADFFHQLEAQSSLAFNFENDLLNDISISQNFKRKSIQDILRNTLKPLDMEYTCISSNSIVIYQKNDESSEILSGFVLDFETLEPLEEVFIETTAGYWTYSQEDGYFRVKSTGYPDTLGFYYPGYQVQIAFAKNGASLNQVSLKPIDELEEITVYALDSVVSMPMQGALMVNIERLKNMPSFLSSPGILNTLSYFPGMQSTIEVNGGMIVRGGGKTENLVLLDGMEIYNPSHMFGLFSAFPNHSLQSVEFYKGGFPSSFSGRLSSVLNVKSKSGNFQKWTGNADLNPIAGELYLTGPIKKGKTAISISGRRSLTDLFPVFYEQIQSQNNIDRFRYYFYDVKARISHKLSDRGSLYLSNYLGGDVGYINQKERSVGEIDKREQNRDNFTQSNNLLSAGWRQWWNRNIFSSVALGYTKYQFQYDNDYNLSFKSDSIDYQRIAQFSHLSRIEDLNGKVELQFFVNSGLSFKLGYNGIRHDFVPNRSGYFLQENDYIIHDTTFDDQSSKANEHRLFWQSDFQHEQWQINAGMSAIGFKSDQMIWTYQPRIYSAWRFSPQYDIHIQLSQTSQFLHAVPNNNLGIPLNVWIPTGGRVDPMYSRQVEIGFFRKINNSYDLQVDYYQRSHDNALAYRYTLYDLVSEWDDAVLVGKGRSKGLELLLNKNKGTWQGWIKYVLSKTDRSFNEINGGKWFPYEYDRRHDLTVVLQYQLNKRWSFGSNFIFSSGHYITIPETQYLLYLEEETILVAQYKNLNNLQVPDYHRFDIGVNYFGGNDTYQIKWGFKIYNVYNRENVHYLTSQINDNGIAGLRPVSLFPFLPSINFAISY